MKTVRLFSLFITLLFIIQPVMSQTATSNLQQEIFEARNDVMPALVNVEPVKSFFTTGEKRHTLVTGSGFIFSKDGYVLTNHHVVENAEKVHCTLNNKMKLTAQVVGSDPSTDVAVLKLNLEEWGTAPLPYARLGNSDSLEVGQVVLALGSPLGLSRSVSMGVISSIDRYFESAGQMVSPYNLWIQTDAAINPGNSGGPLINLKGEVVGINARGVFLAENLGFAIPINLAREIADKLLAGERIQRSWIGLELQPVKDLREYLGKPDLTGVLISSIDPFSPAEKAGLQPGDVLVAIDGQEVKADFDEDLPAVRKIIADLPSRQPVRLEIWRNGKIENIEVTTQVDPFEYLPEFESPDWGLVVKAINRHIFQMENMPDYNGVYISAVKSGGFADRAGLMAGDVIRLLNHQDVRNLQSYEEIYRKLIASGEKTVFFEVRRGGAPYFAAMNVDEKSK